MNKTYVLWRMQKDSLGSFNRVTVNKERKNYPANNIHVEGQYESITDLRQNTAVQECRKCGATIGPDTKIYYGTPILCGECKKQEQVAEKL